MFNPTQQPTMGWGGVFALLSLLFKLRTKKNVNTTVNPCWDLTLIAALPYGSAGPSEPMFSNLTIC